MSTTTVFISTMLLILALAVNQGMAASALCSATRPPGGSKSNSASQQAKECEVPYICECQFATTTVASASTSTAASATESAAPTNSSDASVPASTAASASTSGYNASAEPCPCVLMQELVNMKYLYLSISQQVVFEACLADIRIFLVDVSLDVKQKVGKIGHRLKKCFHENHDIKKLLKHKKIATWGRCYELIAAGVSFDSEQSDSLITFDASGECNLTRALVNATAGDVCGSGSSAQIAVIVGNAKKVLKKMVPGYDKGRKLGWLKKAFVKNLFVLYPQYEVCIRNVSIPGFGSFDQFLNLCDQYETSSSMSNSVLNGSATDCAVVKSLNDSLNSNATVNSTDSATLAEGLNYVQTLSTYFASTTDVVLRLKFVSAQFSALSSACRLLLDGIEIVGTYLSIDFSDVVVTSHFCDNNGCGNITYGSASMTYPETCMIDTAQNISDVEDAVNTFYASLTVIQKIGFNSYKNSIQNCIRSSVYGNNYTARYLCCVPYVTSYSSNNPTLRAAFLATQFVTVLVETVTTVVYGSFGGFCGCS